MTRTFSVFSKSKICRSPLNMFDSSQAVFVISDIRFRIPDGEQHDGWRPRLSEQIVIRKSEIVSPQ